MLLTVCLFTFNHKKYIEKSIESVLMQRTSFNFKILIADDCSTDGTSEICARYKNSFPVQIELISRPKNVGMRENILGTLMNLDSDFVSLIEGDDYWIDPLKLEKQFYFLKNNSGFTLCFHNAIVIDERTVPFIENPKYFLNLRKDKEIKFYDLLNNWIVPTGSMMYRNNSIIFPNFSLETYNWDLLLNLLCAHFGKVMYLSEPMSVYRINEGGNTNQSFYSYIRTIPRQVELLRKFNIFTQSKYNEMITDEISKLNRKLLKDESIIYKIKCRLKIITNHLLLYFGFKVIRVPNKNK